MPVFECKMCGGALKVTERMTICECEYCGTKQTISKIDNEKIINLYNRANHFRQQCAFDKAEQIYEKIVAEMPDDAEAHWSLVLCKYGIEYVEDPSTLDRVPTCHRTSYDSIFEDIDYLETINKSDSMAFELYQKEAAKIDRIQKGILEISQKEKPFDIFICYKETDSFGNRTLDSVKAQEIYDALTDKGYKVFFSRITLEDKLGQAYEPYIFAALNSAKVMLVIGTNPDHINSVWVKNEWSRYIKIMQKQKDKTLIPCYLNMNPYDFPDKFSGLQGQDMSKIGFMQDLLKGIGKLIPKSNNIVQQDINAIVINSKVQGLIQLINFAIEEKNWSKADDFCSQLLMTQPDISIVYLFKLFIGYQQSKDVSNISKKLNSLYTEISEEEKSSINSKNAADYFFAFISNDCLSRAKYIAEKFPKILTSYYGSPKNTSILNYAIWNLKSKKAVKNLLELGIDPNKSHRTYSNTYGQTRYSPLSDAIWNIKNVEMVKLLLEHGVDPNLVENIIYDDGQKGAKSMLSYAVNDAKNVEIVQLLLKHGADPNKSYRISINDYGQTRYSPLGDAIWNIKNIEMVKLLLEHGANANLLENIIYDDGQKGAKSMLCYAVVDAKNKEMVSLLIQHGAAWENKITYGGITRLERNFPYQKYVSKDFVKFLKKQGWRGSLF